MASFIRPRKFARTRGFTRNPLFYFGLGSALLFLVVCNACTMASGIDGMDNQAVVMHSFFNQTVLASNGSLFSSQLDAAPLETPDLKITQGNTLYGVSTPSVVSAKVMGDVFGSSVQSTNEIKDYVVQPGDTMQSVADANNISVNTLAWANDISASATLKAGQTLTLLPVDGVLYVVKSGDTLGSVAQRYKSDTDKIVAFNNLASQDDIYLGDILVLPDGVMPKKSSPAPIDVQVPLADNYFIFPAQGRITQGVHFFNAVDLANQCGTPLYAAAAGVVQRAYSSGAWNGGMGNYVTILHANGTVTYYGHMQTVLVKPGESVYTGQNIGLMGRTGNATGCHVHFEVVGAKNPLAKYPVGSTISYKK